MADVKPHVAKKRVCASTDLQERGAGVRFQVRSGKRDQPAFVIRYEGRPHAFLNRCGHLAVELDWNEGDFFDAEGRFLVCATHGARYDPVSGACTGGRCNGVGLQPIAVEETDGEVHVLVDAVTPPFPRE